MIRTSMRASAPENFNATIVLTADIKELTEMRKQLETCDCRSKWPLAEFVNQLTKAIDWADGQFIIDTDDTPNDKVKLPRPTRLAPTPGSASL